MLGTSDRPLCQAYDLAMLDLDGVVYIGGEGIPGMPAHLAAAREAGMRLAFITNNAVRPPERVADHLTALGITARSEDVVTSAQAAARLLRERFGAGARVAYLGADGLLSALRAAGLVPVDPADDGAVAMATGYGPDVPWSRIMRAAVLIRDGMPWVASNADRTIPTPFGVAPGHGVQVAMLRDFAGVDPVVAGKPERPLLDETIRRVGGERPLMVGDRLDTDIEGARRIGVDSLLVLTGVTGLDELVAAPAPLRPTYIARDLSGLLEAPDEPVEKDGSHQLGGWSATVTDGALRVDGAGSIDDWWRAAATAAWRHLDEVGGPADLSSVAPPAGG